MVERDTLIAVPLFVFMGIMLQKSRIAEDLLVAMARMFGPIPGGLGISVVFVGALLAATTGIVGATVIAMGLISLPAMLRNNYSRPLATGTICASGTLGQIIPPSVVLIILADQLAAAADIASTTRKAEYKAATGEITMPSEFDVVSASAGDMFMGAFFPGLILVAIYMGYILVHALLNPKSAPPVPYEGRMDGRFFLTVALALIPPLTLILAVLGSILAGIATVNQAGAIGAIGATIMGGYRLTAGRRSAFLPAVIAIVSIVELLVVLSIYDINVKNITSAEDVRGITWALVGTTGLLVAIVWSLWRAFAIEDTLKGVMVETAKTTSMVFIILIGAAMLTSAFRAFGGEDLVREYLNSLPGGFWTQFIVVMAVIFLLGFFLDFIEIAVVVIPIVAPILLADPSANITAVWFGVMVGLNIQTSFLTPPFGFALFYLRGVAPAVVKTLEIYRGAAVFIVLQLIGLAIAGTFPSLVNYLPNRVYLSSDTAPPPMNPKLQHCLEDYVFAQYDGNGDALRAHIDRAAAMDAGFLPDAIREKYEGSFELARAGIDLAQAVRDADAATEAYLPEYEPLHVEVRRKQAGAPQAREAAGATGAGTLASHPRRDRDRCADREKVNVAIEGLQAEMAAIEASIPATWESARARYVELLNAQKKARREYRQSVDEAYQTIADLRALVADADALRAFEPTLASLDAVVANEAPEQAMATIKAAERELGRVAGSSRSRVGCPRPAGHCAATHRIRRRRRSSLPKHGSGTRKRLRGGPARRKSCWRGSSTYADAIKHTIGLRVQERLTQEQAKLVAECQSVHRNVSLFF